MIYSLRETGRINVGGITQYLYEIVNRSNERQSLSARLHNLRCRRGLFITKPRSRTNWLTYCARQLTGAVLRRGHALTLCPL